MKVSGCATLAFCDMIEGRGTGCGMWRARGWWWSGWWGDVYMNERNVVTCPVGSDCAGLKKGNRILNKIS